MRTLKLGRERDYWAIGQLSVRKKRKASNCTKEKFVWHRFGGERRKRKNGSPELNKK